MNATWFEKGEIKGQRKLLCALMENRFGELPPRVLERVEEMTGDELTKLGIDLLHAQSLQELRLDRH